jgi:hypothetical protein
VSVKYARRECDSGWRVPPETVIGVVVTPRVRPELTGLGVDLTKYEKIRGDYDVLDHFYYVDKTKGIRLSVRSGFVEERVYEPTTADEYLRCSDHNATTSQTDCLPLAFGIECSSNVVSFGSPVSCRVRFASKPKGRASLSWSITRGGVLKGRHVSRVTVHVRDTVPSDMRLTLRVLSPKLCLDRATTNLKVNQARR